MIRTVAALLATTLTVGCVTHGGLDRGVSQGSRTTATLDEVPVKGFDVDVELASGSASGELLAVEPEGIYLLADDKTSFVAMRDVKKVSVELYSSDWGWMAGWTALGTASTLTHGFYLLFTAPVWLTTGTVTAAVAGASNDLKVTPAQLPRLWQFARFPAGLPASWPHTRLQQAP
jgi:hypothetical protein